MADDFDATSLDDTIHGKLRLGIMAYLSAVSSATFGELKDKTAASDGNLSVHLRKLEEAGYVDGANFQSRVYEGADHNEPAWRERLSDPLTFLLGTERD